MTQRIDTTRFTRRDFQRHREHWEARFAAADGAFVLAKAAPWSPHTFSPAARANLDRIAGGSELGRLAVVLAAMSRLAGSLSGKRSFTVDTPPLAGASGSDTVPLILPVLTDASVADLLREVKEIVALSYTFQDFPARKLLGGDTGTNVLLTCPAIHGAVEGDYDVRIELTGSSIVTSDSAGDLAARLDLIIAAFDDTSRRLSEIAVVTPAERAELLDIGSGPSRPYPAGAELSALFEQCAVRFPERIAVESPARALTYAELLREVRGLSRSLRQHHGVRHGDVVAVVCSRSVEWIVGLLAVLDAGAAYLPLDTALPDARLRHILDQSKPAAVIDGLEVERRECAGDPHPGLAYILYTSGSTGRPKGVMVEHRGFVNMILDQIRVFGVAESDRVLQLASASFDASLSEIFMTLLAGAALVLVDEGTIADGRAFTHYVDEQAVTIMTVTPLYLAALDRHPLPSLRTLITAGDEARLDETLHYARSKRLFNAYGPTEVSVCATMHAVDAGDAAHGTIPVGRPVANSAVYVVDIYGQLLPCGMAGEILFAGPGVARGYLGSNSPAFTDDPFVPGRRCYHTGDRGRWLPDGALAFEGRIDDQLKIRGYRIEPAEIEHALRRHPLVSDAHVGAADTAGHRDLVAWVSTRERIELWPSVAEFFVYDDVVYRAMARDETRNRSYRAALARKVAGKTVLEIGPGPEAVLSRMCVEVGARKVYAVEISAETAERARAFVASLGLSDRIEILHGDVVDLELPEKADVCVSEIVGSIGGSEGAALLINRARRLLSDPRAQIPARSVTKMAGVCLDGHDLDLHFPEIAAHYVERIFAARGGPFDLRLCLKNLPLECIVTTHGVFEDLDFRDDVPLAGAHEVGLRVTRGGALDGFLVWLHLIVDADHPGEAVDILESTGSWLPVWLPFAERIGVATGDEIRATVRRTLSANARNPDFFINGGVYRGGQRVAAIHYDAFHAAPGFRRTPFYQRLFAGGTVPVRPEASPAGLRKFAAELLPAYMIPAHFEVVPRLPMNRSGKVDRKALPQPRWTPDAAPAAPRSEREAAVVAVWEEVLGCRLGIHDNFFLVGGDSIRAIQIAARLGERGLQVTTRDVLENPTPAELAQRVRLRTAAPQEPIAGDLPLTPIQSWFFATVRRDRHHFNQALMLRFHGALDPAGVARAMSAIVEHHDALRSRFTIDDGVVRASIAAPQAIESVEAIDLRGARAVGLGEVTARLQGSLDLEHGPLLRAAILRLDGGDRLLWVVHHLVVDWISWRILVADLQRSYAQWSEGEPTSLPAKSDSFKQWAEEARAQAPSFEPERAYWKALLGAPAVTLPHDPEGGGDLVASVEMRLGEADTASLLGAANNAYNTELTDLLLTALARALENERGPGRAVVLLESHGRDALDADLDVSRTVGWFTTFHPVALDLGGATEAGAQIKRVKESLRGIPSKGTGYLFLAPPYGAQISVNYLGRFGSDDLAGDWQIAAEPVGPSVSPRVERPCELELLASAIDGCLHVALTYNEQRFRRDTAAHLLASLREELLHLTAHCLGREQSEPTISDMSYDALTQEEFESLFAD
jgi:amino acid adenylation domain-containing protein/non-ribosomal peptide synthase protein (TIGR01720 family)